MYFDLLDIELANERYKEMLRDAERRAQYGAARVPSPALGEGLFRKGISWLGAQWANVRRAVLHPRVERVHGEQPAS
jgi:hypothetical protein